LFRPDLYFRLNVIRIHIPPLRERRSDIALLAENFLAINSRKFGKFVSFDDETMEYLMQNDWPGNVRELENAVSRYVVLGKLHETSDLVNERADGLSSKNKVSVKTEEMAAPAPQTESPREEIGLKKVAKEAVIKAEREVILKVLKMTRWNKSKAAKLLKISYKALLYKIKDCGIDQTDTGG
jgi:two-component system response regulator AtoC